MATKYLSAARIKHLELIQTVISRMAHNSFLIKGWSISIATALFALAAKDGSARFPLIAVITIIALWYLDAFYLRQEKIFRNFYNKVLSSKDNSIELFSLDVRDFTADVKSVLKIMVAECNLVFHGVIFILSFIIFIFLYGPSCFL